MIQKRPILAFLFCVLTRLNTEPEVFEYMVFFFFGFCFSNSLCNQTCCDRGDDNAHLCTAATWHITFYSLLQQLCVCTIIHSAARRTCCFRDHDHYSWYFWINDRAGRAKCFAEHPDWVFISCFCLWWGRNHYVVVVFFCCFFFFAFCGTFEGNRKFCFFVFFMEADIYILVFM